MSDVKLGPAQVNLVGIVQNDSWSLALTITVSGTAMDLTGQTINAAIKDGSVSYPLTVAVTNATGGQLTLSQAKAPAFGNYSATWALRVGGRTIISGGVSGTGDILS